MCCRLLVFVLTAALCATAQDSSYRVVANWPQLPAGLALGQATAVATDSRGHVFVFHRGEKPIVVFDSDGKLLRSFGDGLFKSAHGLRVDREDCVWVTDTEGHVVKRFSNDGKLQLTLGEPNVLGLDERHFNKPADIAFAANGDVFVADGYGNSRVVKFDRTGKFLLTWGKPGTGPSEFNVPHNIRVDSRGQVYVADRENNRVQVFDASGKFLTQFGGLAPFGLFITPRDEVFIADGLVHKVWQVGLDGKVVASFGTQGATPGQLNLPHGIHVAADGALYVTEITGKRVQKFVKR